MPVYPMTEQPQLFPPEMPPETGPVPITSAPPPPGGYEGFTEAQADEPETRRRVDTPTEAGVTTLNDEDRAAFSSLMSCGKRSKTIEVMGHEVSIESLNVDDDLRIGMYTKEYRESDAYPRAVQVGTCAAGIRTVDRRALYSSLSPDESPESVFRAKVAKLEKFYPVVITEIYREILNLDAEFADLAIKLGKLKG